MNIEEARELGYVAGLVIWMASYLHAPDYRFEKVVRSVYISRGVPGAIDSIISPRDAIFTHGL
jgi:hypothetical protein